VWFLCAIVLARNCSVDSKRCCYDVIAQLEFGTGLLEDDVRKMYDSVSPGVIPGDSQLVAGYVNGRYAWLPGDWARFPQAVHVEISVLASDNRGHVLDVEPSDATAAEAVGWVGARRAAGTDPTVYCNASTWPSVRQAFAAAGVPEPHYWIAHYDGDPTIPVGAIAKQYLGDVSPGIDISSVADHWPGVDAEADMPFTSDDFAQFMWGNVFDANGNRNFAQFMKDMDAKLTALGTSLDAVTKLIIDSAAHPVDAQQLAVALEGKLVADLVPAVTQAVTQAAGAETADQVRKMLVARLGAAPN